MRLDVVWFWVHNLNEGSKKQQVTFIPAQENNRTKRINMDRRS